MRHNPASVTTQDLPEVDLVYASIFDFDSLQMQKVTEILSNVSELQFRSHVNTRSCLSCNDQDKEYECVSDG